MINFHLCEAGWRLYFAYVERAGSWKDYIDHRRECPECTRPMEKDKQNAD